MKVGSMIVSILVILLAVGIVAAPPPVGSNPASLKTAHEGTTWGAAGFETETCDTPAGKPYGWHFVMNQVRPDDTPSADINVDFVAAGNFTVQAAQINQNLVHFYVFTATKDTINDASGHMPAGWTANPDMVLSHFCGTPKVPEFPTVAIPALFAIGGYLALRLRRD